MHIHFHKSVAQLPRSVHDRPSMPHRPAATACSCAHTAHIGNTGNTASTSPQHQTAAALSLKPPVLQQWSRYLHHPRHHQSSSHPAGCGRHDVYQRTSRQQRRLAAAKVAAAALAPPPQPRAAAARSRPLTRRAPVPTRLLAHGSERPACGRPSRLGALSARPAAAAVGAAAPGYALVHLPCTQPVGGRRPPQI